MVIRYERNQGITKATQSGIQAAHGEIIVTMDADGQHKSSDIPKLTEPIVEGKADLTLGVRDEIPYGSEKMINQLTNLKVKCSDVGTGFRAMRADLAKQMKLHATCLCGTFLLEADKKRAKITEVPIEIKQRTHGERGIKTRHIKQFFYVLKDIIF